jgi:hypothetical protein
MSLRLPRSLSGPSAEIIERARHQMLAHWPTVVRVTRFASAEAAAVAGTLDYEIPSSLVYEGRARVTINQVSSEVYEEEEQQSFTGSLVLPYSVQGRLVRPLVNDSVLVLEVPDAAMDGLTARIVGLNLAGHMAVVRECRIAGTARSRVWTSVTPEPVRDSVDAD